MEKRKKYLEWLGFIAAATFIICFVAMIFFRIEPLRKGLKSILHILMPFIYGAVIAYLLKPVSLFFEKCLQKLNRNDNPKAASLLRMASILLSLLFFLVIIFLLMVAVVPGMASSITTLVRSMNSYVNQFQVWLEGYAQTEYGKEIVAVLEQGLETLTDRLQSWLKGDILPNLTSYITRVTDSFSVLFDILKNFGLGMIVAVYLMNVQRFYPWQDPGLRDRGNHLLYLYNGHGYALRPAGQCNCRRNKYHSFLRPLHGHDSVSPADPDVQPVEMSGISGLYNPAAAG